MDPALSPRPVSDTVMASVDGEETDEQLIIADVTRDDAWLSMAIDEAPALTRWR